MQHTVSCSRFLFFLCLGPSDIADSLAIPVSRALHQEDSLSSSLVSLSGKIPVFGEGAGASGLALDNRACTFLANPSEDT